MRCFFRQFALPESTAIQLFDYLDRDGSAADRAPWLGLRRVHAPLRPENHCILIGIFRGKCNEFMKIDKIQTDVKFAGSVGWTWPIAFIPPAQ